MWANIIKDVKNIYFQAFFQRRFVKLHSFPGQEVTLRTLYYDERDF